MIVASSIIGPFSVAMLCYASLLGSAWFYHVFLLRKIKQTIIFSYFYFNETDEGLHGRGSFHMGTLVLYRQHETVYDIPTLVSHTVGLHAHFDCIYP